MSLAYNFLYMLQQSPPDLFHVKSLDSVLTHLSMVRLIEMDIQNQETLIEVPEKVLHELKLNGSISRLQDNLQQIQSIRYESEVDKALVRSELIFSNQQAPQCHMFEALAYEVSKYNNDFQGYKIAKKLELQQSKRNLFPRIEFYTSILLDLINIPTALFDIILLLSQLPHGLKPNRQITF
ncbi:MAG: hypothetical protein E7E23_04910 [Paenibacillus sp.]|uniref:hypothetical protein n=1 Tax=Paenibacillus sp. TaxID=58172 RepID=UPI0028FEC4B3|nr:hypothetical protein [Paenibacillus sp.]MDU2239898.1 hypothetical protein [Paenibacillus sp.]